MNELKIFENEQFGQIRAIMKDGEPWFVANDVCRILELGDTSKAVSRLDDDEKGTNSIPTPGGNQNMLTINEPGLYSLVLGSRKPEAKQFKRWLTHEVLPAIRQTGMYMVPRTAEEFFFNPDTIIKIASNWKAERSRRIVAERQIEEEKPCVIFAKSVESSKTSILIGELAKIIKQNGANIGRDRLFEWMREHGYIEKRGENRNLPTQKSMNMKLLEIKKTTINNPDGSNRVTRTTKVTGKGQIYFTNIFLGKQKNRLLM